MGEFVAGTQAQVRNFEAEPLLNGQTCVCLTAFAGGERAVVRLGSGRELVVPLRSLKRVAETEDLPAGTGIVVEGLAKAPQLNGRKGVVAKGAHTSGRVLVDLGNGEVKALKYENLVIVDADEAGEAAAKAVILRQGGFYGKPKVGAAAAYPLGTKVEITKSAEPDLDGRVGIVLWDDCYDDRRLMVWMPNDRKVRSFLLENLLHTRSEASASELEAMRAPLRKALVSAVRKLLWCVPHEVLRIANVACPGGDLEEDLDCPGSKVLSAWTAYFAFCGRGKTLHSVLKESLDLFRWSRDGSGYELVGLTETGRGLNLDEGIPKPARLTGDEAAPRPQGAGTAARVKARYQVGGGQLPAKPFPLGTKVEVANCSDPSLNGMVCIAICADCRDQKRQIVWMPNGRRAESFGPENLAHARGPAPPSELNAIRTPIKEAFYASVRGLLHRTPQETIRLASLTRPSGGVKSEREDPASRVLFAWATFAVLCMPKGGTLQTILKHKPDLFQWSRDEGGFEMVGLTDKSRFLNIDDDAIGPSLKRRKLEEDVD